MAKQSEVTLWIKIKQQGAELIKSVTGGLKEFGASLLEVKALAIEAAAVITEQIGERLVKAFAEGEQAIIKLNAMLRVTGRYSDEGTEKIQAMAEALSKMGLASKDQLLGVSVAVGQIAKTLSPEQLANVQKMAVGLAQITGGSVESAGQRIARTLAGQMNAFRRLGIEIDMTGTQQERYNQIMTKSAPLWQIAEEASHSLSAQMAASGFAFEELKKTLGQVIVETLNLGTGSTSLRDRIIAIDDSIKKNMGSWVHWGQVVVEALKVAWQLIVLVIRDVFNFGEIIGRILVMNVENIWDMVHVVGQGADVMVDYFKYAWAGVKYYGAEGINFVLGLVNQLIGWVNEKLHLSIPFLAELPQQTTDAMVAARTTVESDAGKIQATFGGIRDRVRNVARDVVGDINDMNDAGNDFSRSIEHLIKVWNQPILPASRFNISTKGGGANLGPKSGEDPELLAKNLTEKLKTLRAQFENNKITVDEFKAGLDVLGPKMLAVLDMMEDGAKKHAFAQEIDTVQHSLEKMGLTFDKDGVRVLSVMENLRNKTREAAKQMGTLQMVVADMALNTFKGLMTAIQSAFQAMVDGSKSAGAAFASAMLGALSAVAAGFGNFFLGRATAALAEALLPSNMASGLSGAAIASAAKWTAAAGAMFALSGVLGGMANKVGSAGGGGGGAAGQSRSQTDAVTNQKEPGTIIVQGGLLDMSDPRQADALAGALMELDGRRVIIKAG